MSFLEHFTLESFEESFPVPSVNGKMNITGSFLSKHSKNKANYEYYVSFSKIFLRIAEINNLFGRKSRNWERDEYVIFRLKSFFGNYFITVLIIILNIAN